MAQIAATGLTLLICYGVAVIGLELLEVFVQWKFGCTLTDYWDLFMVNAHRFAPKLLTTSLTALLTSTNLTGPYFLGLLIKETLLINSIKCFPSLRQKKKKKHKTSSSRTTRKAIGKRKQTVLRDKMSKASHVDQNLKHSSNITKQNFVRNVVVGILQSLTPWIVDLGKAIVSITSFLFEYLRRRYSFSNANNPHKKRDKRKSMKSRDITINKSPREIQFDEAYDACESNMEESDATPRSPCNKHLTMMSTEKNRKTRENIVLPSIPQQYLSSGPYHNHIFARQEQKPPTQTDQVCEDRIYKKWLDRRHNPQLESDTCEPSLEVVDEESMASSVVGGFIYPMFRRGVGDGRPRKRRMRSIDLVIAETNRRGKAPCYLRPKRLGGAKSRTSV